MESDSDDDVYRHDDDSGDEYFNEISDRSSSSGEEPDSDQANGDLLVGDQGDGSRSRPNPNTRGRRGRGSDDSEWVWEVLDGDESINPREWIMNFDASETGAKNIGTLDSDEFLDLDLEERPVAFFKLFVPDAVIDILFSSCLATIQQPKSEKTSVISFCLPSLFIFLTFYLIKQHFSSVFQ